MAPNASIDTIPLVSMESLSITHHHARIDGLKNKVYKPLRTKSVQWAPKVSVRPFKKISVGHSQSIWYEQEDFKHFKEDAKQTIRLILAGKSKGHESFFAHGLETYLPSRKALQRERREAAWDAVMDEQASQRSKRVNSADAIAKVYKGVSRLCHQKAHTQGLDEKDAIKVNLTFLR